MFNPNFFSDFGKINEVAKSIETITKFTEAMQFEEAKSDSPLGSVSVTVDKTTGKVDASKTKKDDPYYYLPKNNAYIPMVFSQEAERLFEIIGAGKSDLAIIKNLFGACGGAYILGDTSKFPDGVKVHLTNDGFGILEISVEFRQVAFCKYKNLRRATYNDYGNVVIIEPEQ